MVHAIERTENGLKEWFTALISVLLLQAVATGFSFGRCQLQAALEQGHLGGRWLPSRISTRAPAGATRAGMKLT